MAMDQTWHDREHRQQGGIWGERAVNGDGPQVPEARRPAAGDRITPRPSNLRAVDTPLTARHYTIVVVDVVGFGDRSRRNSNQVRIRRGLYHAMEHSFNAAGIPWSDCMREDRGDGLLILVPAEVPKAVLVDELPETLADALAAHNKRHPTEEQIRLRLALHAGEIVQDEHGVTSSSLTHTFRILEAPVLKATLAASSGVLAIISSTWFYDEVIWQSDLSQSDSYEEAEVTCKETTTRAWIRVVGARRAKRRDPVRTFTLYQRRRPAK
jgi:class 3 adenylate cyclase